MKWHAPWNPEQTLRTKDGPPKKTDERSSVYIAKPKLSPGKGQASLHFEIAAYWANLGPQRAHAPME